MNSQEDRIIDLSQNYLLARFFEGWDPIKAHEFAQNLLLIGVGVAYKMLNENAPEQAFEKIHKMACKVVQNCQFNLNVYVFGFFKKENVVKDYSKIEDASKQNKPKKQTYQVDQRNKDSTFNRRQNTQPEMGNNHAEEQIRKEIYKVQQKLQKLNSRLEQQSKEISFENKSSEMPLKRKYLQSPVTQKITQIPPPQLRFASPGRQIQSLSGSRHHLNDEAIKECMNNPWDTENEEVDFRQSRISDNFQFPQMRDSSVNRSSERFSDTYFSTGFNFLNQHKHHHCQSPSKQEQVQNKKKSKEEEDNVKKRKADKSYQQFRSSNSPKQQKKVESRIKTNILANREQQHPQNYDSDRTRDPQYFKQMMIKEHIPSKNQSQAQLPSDQQGNKDKNDIVNEMGVVFSKEAQRKFYEKKDKEMKLLEQQKRYSSDQLLRMQVRKQGNLQMMQQQQFTYPDQTIQASSQAQYLNPNERPQGYYAQQPQHQIYQMERMRDNQLNPSVDVIRENTNIQQQQQQYPTQFSLQPIPNSNTNILEIANEFLSSPFIRQFDDEEEEDGSRQQYQNNLEQVSYEPQQQDSSQQYAYQDQRIQHTGSQYLNSQNQYPQKTANYSNFQEGKYLPASQEATQNQFYPSNMSAQQTGQQFPSFNPNAESPRVEISIQGQSKQNYFYPQQEGQQFSHKLSKSGIEGEYDDNIQIQQQFNARHSGQYVPRIKEEGRQSLSEQQQQVQQFQNLRLSNNLVQNPLQQQQGQISNAHNSQVLKKQKEVQFQR